MAARITLEQIKQLNLAYLQCHTYSGAARAVGVSPSTAKKYIIPNYEIPQMDKADTLVCATAIADIVPFTSFQDIYTATQLTNEEKIQMKELWKELYI
jgi:hypothetical protein